jgi:hypothetical protein
VKLILFFHYFELCLFYFFECFLFFNLLFGQGARGLTIGVTKGVTGFTGVGSTYSAINVKQV